jgi:hypothetical protein
MPNATNVVEYSSMERVAINHLLEMIIVKDVISLIMIFKGALTTIKKLEDDNTLETDTTFMEWYRRNGV